ncbi:MAG: TolC family protein [Candidatus Latescibacterota bacterium]
MTAKILLIVALLCPAASHAQEAQTLNLEVCLKIALEHNADLIGSGLDEERSKVDLRSSLGPFLPSLNSQFSVNMQDEARYITSETRGPVRTKKNYRFDLSANYSLFNGFGDRASYRASQRIQKSRQLTHERTREDIALLVIQRYLACLKADQFVRISRDALQRSKAQLEKMEAMLEVGTVPRADVMKQKVQFGNDRLSLIQSQIESERARTDLFSVLGIDGVPETARLEEVTIDTSGTTIPFDEALRSARTHRKDLASLDQLSEAAVEQHKAARSGLFPSLSASASYGFSDVALPRSLADVDKIDGASYGLTLRIPIFNRLQTRSQIEQADIALRQRQEQQKSAQLEIALEIRNALNEIVATKEHIAAARENLGATQEDLRLAEENYRLGAGILLDRIIASVQLAQAEANHVDALYNYMLGKARLKKAMGVLIESEYDNEE